MPASIAKIINYWLGDEPGLAVNAQAQTKLWYDSNDLIDEEISMQFGESLQLAGAGELSNWEDSSHGCLALIILLDQFTRNLNRGTALAWKNDQRALEVAEQCIDRGLHNDLPILGRVVLYHPFHHAESRQSQQRAVELFNELLHNSEEDWQPLLKSYADFAVNHADIVARFGRFPHRNNALNRPSTESELTYLMENPKRYGQ